MTRGVLPKDSMENLANSSSSATAHPQRRATTPYVITAAERTKEELENARRGNPSKAHEAEADAKIRHDNRVFEREQEDKRRFDKNWRKHVPKRALKADSWGEWDDRHVRGLTLTEPEGGVDEAKEILKDVLVHDKHSKKTDPNLKRASICSLSHQEQAYGSGRRSKIYGMNVSAL